MISFKKMPKILWILGLVIAVSAFLRIYQISNNPPSLFGDELDLGYHAYSILKTGKDYQGNFMPLNFHSLAEWRTPLYLYSAVPSVAVFGITPLGVRLPAVIFGILGVLAIYFLAKEITGNEKIGIMSSILLAISPWHLQYSRAGFEVTEMLLFFILGLYYFLRSLKNGKLLWVPVVLFTFTPWIYSTAKLFAPFLMVAIFFIWRKEILSLGKNNLVRAAASGLIVGIPLICGILFGGATQRFSYISVFADPTTEPEIGSARAVDSKARGEIGTGLSPKFTDKIVHNKFTYWGEGILKNYFESFSTEFLFIKGDPDPRQSVGIGEMYRIEAIGLILGLIFFFTQKEVSGKNKLLTAIWLLMAPIPAALTKDGGDHATRLILMLPPLIILTAYGWHSLYNKVLPNYSRFVFGGIVGLYLVSFAFYLHEYYVHYPMASERWWHYGWGPAITEVKKIDSNYDKVFISMSGEPAWIFFAGYYQYPPTLWQKEFPIGRDVTVAGFGKISHTGKFYFGSPQGGLYEWGKFLNNGTLYLANASEMKINLITDPDRVPKDLHLIKAIPYPSGEPAFYLFSGVSPK